MGLFETAAVYKSHLFHSLAHLFIVPFAVYGLEPHPDRPLLEADGEVDDLLADGGEPGHGLQEGVQRGQFVRVKQRLEI